MSHHKEREEKICLNCNTEIHGRYCHKCGQENTEPQESFWHLVTHFVYDVTHFDGKFFSTLKHLLFRPGYLPAEYLRGRRTSYLHPIRMYVFTSAIFFVIFLTFVAKPGTTNNKGFTAVRHNFIDSFYATKDSDDKEAIIMGLNASGGLDNDQVYIDSAHHDSIASYRYIYADVNKRYNKPFKSEVDSIRAARKYKEELASRDSGKINLVLNGEKLPNSVAEYNLRQAKLPPAKRDGWFRAMVDRKAIELNEEWHADPTGFQNEIKESFLHSIPKMMFVSVPFVALIMQLLYIRRRKTYYYVNHVIFIIYLYIETFISLLVFFGLSALYDVSNFAPFHWLAVIVMIYIFLYCLLAMHNFYKQGYIKSFLKYFILLFVCSILSVFIASIFLITSLIQI